MLLTIDCPMCNDEYVMDAPCANCCTVDAAEDRGFYVHGNDGTCTVNVEWSDGDYEIVDQSCACKIDNDALYPLVECQLDGIRDYHRSTGR